MASIRKEISTSASADLVWSISERLTHHNASAQVFPGTDEQTRVVWIADLLPNEAAGPIGLMMEQGMTVMKATLDRVAKREPATK